MYTITQNTHTTQMNRKSTRSKCSRHIVFLFSLVLVFGVFFLHEVKAQTYPFKNLPDTIMATLTIETTKTEVFNNKLLGYNISRFTTADEKEIIKKFDPITIRFPQGIFSNWYNWRIDDFTFYSPWIDESHKAVVDGQPKAGVLGLESLNNEKAQTNNVGYDFLITWNMSDDASKGNNSTTNTESIERLKHYKAIGFDVNAIEFGNELFYRNQRSPFVSDEAGFLGRAKPLAMALKEVDKDVKISIPLIPRGSFTNPNWNKLIATDTSYYDAITVHKYIGVDVDNRLDLSNIGYEFGLTARLTLQSAITFALKFAKDKPVWLTEWGVDVGESPTGNAASCLGMADCYMYMSENQDIYQRANWYCANGSANQLIKLVEGTFSTIEYPLKKTGYGFTYDIIRSVFENSTLLSSTVSTQSQLELIGSSVDAVSARVVVKDGKTLILALNLTDKPAEFQINRDGSIFSDGYELESVTFTDVADMPLIPFDANPYNFSQSGSGIITLPPLSINKITLKGPVEYAVKFESPENGVKMEMGADLIVEASAGSAVSSVSLFVNDSLVRTITSAPYKWGEDSVVDVALKNLEVGFYNLKLVAVNADTINFFDSITIEIEDSARQYPYKGIIQVPGTLEVENYDVGGEGESYHDTDPENKGNEYRTDGVDMGSFSSGLINIGWTANGEWLEYTIDVAETASYDMDIRYSAGRTAPAKVGLELPEEGKVLFSNFTLPLTANWDTYTTITKKNIPLTKGKHILRLNISVSGCNIDKLSFTKEAPTATNKIQMAGLKVYPNPSNDGCFSLSQAQKWVVFNMAGIKIMEGESTQIDISPYASGVYMLKTKGATIKLFRQ